MFFYIIKIINKFVIKFEVYKIVTINKVFPPTAVVRTLTGHKSSIKSLDFHPYGEFVASGSLDTNLKVSNFYYS